MRNDAMVAERLKDWGDSLAQLIPILEGDPATQTLDELRDNYVTMLKGHPVPENLIVEHADLGGVPGTVIMPPEVIEGRTLVYFHGGAYIFGASAGYLGLGGRLALALSTKVVLPDYRLAPEHAYPTPIEDCLAVYKWLLDEGHDPDQLVFAGDSAGGSLTVSVMVHARDAGLPLPAGGVAISPWADLEHTGSSMSSRHGLDPLCTKDALDVQARTFLAGAPANSPDASPVFADVSGLPPILVQIGENEVMLSGAMRLATHLAESRVRTTLEVWPGMFHVWHLFAAILPDGQQAIDNAADFLRQAIESRRSA
ncbi:alpha/beta hydrolase [Arthrobacter humicola]|uniref:Alpha/beta hydrolase n=1 Tax=Arthrobacter humicola TaxID=409291 RepID=A0ABP5KI13_9MICC